MKVRATTLLIAVYANLVGAADAPAETGAVARYEPPKLIRFAQLPDRTAQMTGEAYVFIEFDLSAKGDISNARLSDEGFAAPQVARDALSTLKRSKYKPATMDGVPVDSYGLRQPIHLGLTGSQGVTKEFRAELLKVGNFIRQGDYAGAHHHAQWMLAEKVSFSYEYAVLKAELAQTHAGVGNIHAALTAAREATRRGNSEMVDFDIHQPVVAIKASAYMLPKPIVVSLLELRIRLALSSGLLMEALHAWYELAGLSDFAKDDPRARRGEQIAAILESDQLLIGKLRLDERGGWNHEPSRRTFSIDRVEGELEGFGLKCKGGTRLISYQANMEWTIPKSWRGCSLYIDGTPGTTFEIIEHKNPAVATTP